MVKGGAGDFLAGLVSRLVTEKVAPKLFCKKALASSCVAKDLLTRALMIFPSLLRNSAVIL